jgi:hypothetical protein
VSVTVPIGLPRDPCEAEKEGNSGELTHIVDWCHMSDTSDRASRISVRRYSSASEADRDDLRYWLQIPEAERVLEVWRLSVEQWRLRGEPTHEPGLCRSVARLRRR